jgi:hypothetical protein
MNTKKIKGIAEVASSQLKQVQFELWDAPLTWQQRHLIEAAIKNLEEIDKACDEGNN